MPLFIVATPIGNLKDITLRALETLGAADLIACEDTRQTRKLLTHYRIHKPTVSLHEHNEVRRIPELMERLGRGLSIALVSDAGTPLISDPGERLVRAAIAAGFEIVPIPGPSAVTSALVVSGFAAQPFAFFGFLPRKGRARREALQALGRFGGTVVLYEAPGRVVQTLSDLHAELGARRVAVCRELTKLHEQIVRGVLGGLEIRELRGEFTLVIEGPDAGAQAEEPALDPDARAAELLATGLSARDAARILASELGLSRRDAYARVNALRQSR